MPIVVSHRGIFGDVAGTIARLESLIHDIERLGSGNMPSTRELESAPLLEPFTIATQSRPCLIGGISDHPTLKGPVITTSELWIMAPELGWARTYSRLYRLGHLSPRDGRP